MVSIKIDKGRIFATTLFSILLLTGCTKKEYIEIDRAPQLEITVIDTSNNSVEGATVKLYNSEEGFYLNENPIKKSVTDKMGKVLFKELTEIIYYFYVEKGELNNYYEVVTFSEPLRKNEIRTITCVIR
jgi:hypothetical protein